MLTGHDLKYCQMLTKRLDDDEGYFDSDVLYGDMDNFLDDFEVIMDGYESYSFKDYHYGDKPPGLATARRNHVCNEFIWYLEENYGMDEYPPLGQLRTWLRNQTVPDKENFRRRLNTKFGKTEDGERFYDKNLVIDW